VKGVVSGPVHAMERMSMAARGLQPFHPTHIGLKNNEFFLLEFQGRSPGHCIITRTKVTV
jgi:hypothetical protein